MSTRIADVVLVVLAVLVALLLRRSYRRMRETFDPTYGDGGDRDAGGPPPPEPPGDEPPG